MSHALLSHGRLSHSLLSLGLLYQVSCLLYHTCQPPSSLLHSSQIQVFCVLDLNAKLIRKWHRNGANLRNFFFAPLPPRHCIILPSRHHNLFSFAPVSRCRGGASSGASAQHWSRIRQMQNSCLQFYDNKLGRKSANINWICPHTQTRIFSENTERCMVSTKLLPGIPKLQEFGIVRTAIMKQLMPREWRRHWSRVVAKFFVSCYREMRNFNFVFSKIFLEFRENCAKHKIEICVKISRNSRKVISQNTKHEFIFISSF